MSLLSGFLRGLWHNFTALPVVVKLIVGIVVLFVLLVATIITVFTIAAIRYERTDETPSVRLDCGADSLTINRVRRQFVGGTTVGNRLYWNGKAVAKSWSLEGAGQADQAVPVDPDDLRGLPVNRMRDTTEVPGWTIWVSPDAFSRAEYDALVACVTQKRAEIERQLATEPTRKPDESYRPNVGPVSIGAVVYGQGDALKPRTYAWQTPWGVPYELRIDPDGRVDLRQDNVSLTIGYVTVEGKQRVLTWDYVADMTVLGRDLAAFRNSTGQSLVARYRLRPAPNGSQVFFRRTATHYEQVYIGPPRPADSSDSLWVSAMVVDLNSPAFPTNYAGGTIQQATVGRAKPVFHWQNWPGHPITEADLRQFRNEQGQALGDIFNLIKEL